jgi:hypothetical protein
METPVELQAANSLLKRGRSYKIPAPLFFRLLGRKNIRLNITMLCAGTDLRVSAILAEKGITEDKVKNTPPSEFMLEHYHDIIRIVALSTLNRFAFSRLAMWFRMRLLRSMNIWQLFELYTVIRRYSGLTAFMSITRLIIDTRMTRKNLGQMEAGV